jgi:subtilisin family serine protease
MSKILISCALLFFYTALFAQFNPESHQIILQLKGARMSDPALANHGKTGLAAADQISQQFGALRVHAMRAGKQDPKCLYTILFPDNAPLAEILAAYQRLDKVEYAEIDPFGTTSGISGQVPPQPVLPLANWQPLTGLSIQPNDPLYTRQWGLNNNGSFTLSPAVSGADIDMEKAWSYSTGDTNTIVCIMDSGMKLDHPEFAGRLWVNKNEIPGNGIDDDQDGYVDDVNGWDFANNDNIPKDDLGHGTNVTGIIGANGNNNYGYAGINWHCKLMPLKGIDQNNFGYYSWWAEAITYAVDHGAKAINLSVGGSSYSPVLGSAITYALNNNVVCVICMMNGNTSSVFYPAGFPGVIAVGSTNPNDMRTHPFFWDAQSGSNYGNHISVVAPGNYIYGLNHNSDTNFDSYWGGTSQATPHVTGLVSLLLAQDPNRTPAQIKTILQNTAEDKVGFPMEDLLGWDQYYGYGRINAYQALKLQASAIQEPLLPVRLSIFPNPSTGSFRIVRISTTPGTCTVLDATGKLVLQTRIDQQTTLELHTTLAPGLYVVKVQTEEGLEMGRLLIQK